MKAFIVGNGPILNRTDLNKLKGEISFGVNRIHLIFDKTDWRPTHYVCAESADGTKPKQVTKDLKSILELGITSWLDRSYEGAWRSNMRYEHKNSTVNFLPPCCSHAEPPITWHDPICHYGGSLNVAIQLAVKMGCSEIYLVGCDLGAEHFDQDYGSELSNWTQNYIHAAHEQAMRSSPVPIYNATIGGKLDVYPRVKFEEIWAKPEPAIIIQTEKAMSSTNTLLSTPKKSPPKASPSTNKKNSSSTRTGTSKSRTTPALPAKSAKKSVRPQR